MNAAQAAGPKRRPTRRRLFALLPILALLVAPAFLLRSRGNTPRPVVETTLEQTGILKWLGVRAWQDLPFTLTAEEVRDVDRCVALVRRINTTHNDVSPFTAETTKQELETILRARPGFFYAEYLLGLWHQEQGDRARGETLYAQALEHAPAVLVQPYRFRDGRPLAGSVIARMEIECNRVRNGWLDPSLKLAFFNLRTDGQGNVRVPVYRTVYRVSSVSNPDEFDTEYPRLGWFETRGKTGILPAATVAPEK